jgi:hypothetical protein
MAAFTGMKWYQVNDNNLAIAKTSSGVIEGRDPTDEFGNLTIGTGTITALTSSTTVTGTGTDFVAAQIAVGDILFANPDTYLGEVAAVLSTTSIRLTKNATTAVSGIAFSFIRPSLILPSSSVLLRIPAGTSGGANTADTPITAFLRSPAVVGGIGNFADVNKLKVLRESTIGVRDEFVTPVPSPFTPFIPCTIVLQNNFTVSGNVAFPTAADIPRYLWYIINMYGDNSNLLPNSTTLSFLIESAMQSYVLYVGIPKSQVFDGRF